MTGEDKDIDDEIVVDNYLVQNIKQEEVVKSLEVQAIKREREGLETQEANKTRLPFMKTNRTGTYIML